MDSKSRLYRNRALLLWVIGSGLWLAGVEIYTAATRPAPGFKDLIPWVVGGPGVGLVLALIVAAMLARRGR